MKQLTEMKINGNVYTFEQEFLASDGCKVVLDVERLEDDWAVYGKPGQSYQEFKQERLATLNQHPHELQKNSK